MSNTDTKIKSEILVSEIQNNTLLLKDAILKEQDINEILKNIVFSLRKLDNLYDNKLKDFDDILTNDFMR